MLRRLLNAAAAISNHLNARHAYRVASDSIGHCLLLTREHLSVTGAYKQALGCTRGFTLARTSRHDPSAPRMACGFLLRQLANHRVCGDEQPRQLRQLPVVRHEPPLSISYPDPFGRALPGHARCTFAIGELFSWTSRWVGTGFTVASGFRLTRSEAAVPVTAQLQPLQRTARKIRHSRTASPCRSPPLYTNTDIH
jgi:hypothetical protein